jgi:biopolymer transport protein ExbB
MIKDIFNSDDNILIIICTMLIAMSFTSWYIIFWKFLQIKQEKTIYRNFSNKFLHIKNWPLSESFLNNINNFKGSLAVLFNETNIVKNFISDFDYSTQKEILQMHLIQKLDEIRFNYEKGLAILASIGSISPFIGLFGTVIGIHNALNNIAKSGNGGINIISGPVSEALIATAIGLFTAIPAIFAYNAFVRFNRLEIQNLRHIAEQLTIYNRPQIKKENHQ